MEQAVSFPTFMREQIDAQLAKKMKFCCRVSAVYAFLRFASARKMPPALEALARGNVLAEAEALVAADKPLAAALAPCESCRKSALLGIYLAVGTISVPAEVAFGKKATSRAGYHMEFFAGTQARAEELAAFFAMCGVAEPMHLTTRLRGVAGYYKKISAIEDMLLTMGLSGVGFRFMDLHAARDIANNVNRRTNWDDANIRKTVASAGTQLAAVEYLAAKKLLGGLPPALQETARLRLENPAASLSELMGLHEVPLTRSGVNHRLAKLVSVAEAHRARHEKKDT